MEKTPARHEQVSFDELGAEIKKHQDIGFPSALVLFVDTAHEQRKPEMSDEDYAQFCEEHPRPSEDEVAEAKEIRDREEKRFADQLGIEVSELPKLISAHNSEESRRIQNDTVREFYPDETDQYPGMYPPCGETHLDAASAVLILANLTGQPYKISNIGYHRGSVEEKYLYEVKPNQTLQEIFPQFEPSQQ